MKVLLQDDAGKTYDAEYPDGTAISHIVEEARKQLGFNVRHVDRPIEQSSGGVDKSVVESHAREIKRAESALSRSEKECDELRAEVSELKRELAAAEKRCGDLKHAKSDATTAAANDAAKLYACEQSLESERKARIKAEERCAKLKGELSAKESAPSQHQAVAWTIEVVSRDNNGFTQELRMQPERMTAAKVH